MRRYRPLMHRLTWHLLERIRTEVRIYHGPSLQSSFNGEIVLAIQSTSTRLSTLRNDPLSSATKARRTDALPRASCRVEKNHRTHGRLLPAQMSILLTRFCDYSWLRQYVRDSNSFDYSELRSEENMRDREIWPSLSWLTDTWLWMPQWQPFQHTVIVSKRRISTLRGFPSLWPYLLRLTCDNW